MEYGSNALATISEDGKVPETRMTDSRQAQDFSRRLIDNDMARSLKRSRVNGLVDGNPPYRSAKLAAAGRADACNVNWGTARSYLESSAGAFYDLFSEAPGFFSFYTSHGTEEQREEWSSTACKHADKIMRDDPKWDAFMQKSQKQMVLHGVGPFYFEDGMKVIPKAILSGDLKVPEFTPSDTADWDVCTLQDTYYPPQLYDFIKNEAAAKAVGWNVEYTKKVIANAMDIRTDLGVQREWEFCQQQLKNNSLTFYDDSLICRIIHVFWKEFDGRVTHAIVERDTSQSLATEYLFLRVGRYASFAECVHPMYFDIGTNGYHHEITGLGVKMFSAMEYQNRLICNLCDKAFSPKLLFKPTSTERAQAFSLTKFGDYATLPAGFDFQQSPIGGFMNDGESMLGLISGTMQENLSTYRGSVPDQKSGNPVTKFEKQLQAAQQSALNKTQFNRYYKQLDMLCAEIWRRLSNPNSTDEKAQEFQRKCKKDGVPIEALNRHEYIGANRVVGQGSAFMRKTAIDSLFPIAGSLPETGRQNLIADKIAAEAGQTAVARYFPRQKQTMPDAQQDMAMLHVAAMESGVPPLVTVGQNALTYAATYTKAATDALQSLQQGGDPMKVLAFLHLCGPAIAAQLQRISQDPTRKDAVNALFKQWQQIAQATDQLQENVKRLMDEQKGQKQRTQQTMSDAQLKEYKLKHDVVLKTQKTQAQMRQSADNHQLKVAQKIQDLQLKDATTAAEIHRSRLKSLATTSEDN